MLSKDTSRFVKFRSRNIRLTLHLAEIALLVIEWLLSASLQGLGVFPGFAHGFELLLIEIAWPAVGQVQTFVVVVLGLLTFDHSIGKLDGH